MDKKNKILITDIGSTTTKGLLLEKAKERYIFLAQHDTPTTVEKPQEDVGVGLENLIESFNQELDLDLKLGSGGNCDYLTTSSAGGGLQILVFGLSSMETGTVAEMTAYGAGGVVLRTFTVDDKVSAVEKMRLMQDLHPDLILMAGGMDGGAISQIVELAEILCLAKPTPKFRKGERIPLVFCGNIEARDFIERTLQDNFELHMVENVRPNMERMNTEPTKREIHKLFMENVMEHAPGYSNIKNIVSADILPTPSGVEKILDNYVKSHKDNVAMVDIGGATTDIFTIINNNNNRTVAANIGMSYSLSNILSDAGIDNIMNHLDGFEEGEVRNYITNKTLNPTYVPQQEEEKKIEYACAIEGMKIAWKLHKDMNFKIKRVGFLDRHKKSIKNANKWEEVLSISKKEKYFQLSDISLIIGAGGVISHMDLQQALLVLADAFSPYGITKIAVDRFFKSPHMGVLTEFDEKEALRLFEKECLEYLGYVIAPIGIIKSGKSALKVKNLDSNKEFEMNGGEVKIIWEGGRYEIECGKKLCFKKGEGKIELETEKPIILDCRCRENKKESICTIKYNKKRKYKILDQANKRIEDGEFEVKRKLPYEGEILAKKGQYLEPDDIIGENKYGPPRIYIINLNKIVGYDESLSEKEINDGILVSEESRIKVGQKIFKNRSGILGTKTFYHSPVRGRITKIEKSGMIIVREIQDYDDRPRKINVAKAMDIKPKHVRGHLKYQVGDFVEKGQILASNMRRGLIAKSPATGAIKEIDTKSGNVTIQYDIQPVRLKAFIRGEISEIVKHYSVNIRTNAIKLYGKVGFGGEASGEILLVDELENVDDIAGKILVSFKKIDDAFLRKCSVMNVAGIIAPSIENRDWVDFYGKEIGVAVTGDEKLPYAVIITEGFGDFKMSDYYESLFKESQGKTVSLSGRTQIRAGVIRPVVLIYK